MKEAMQEHPWPNQEKLLQYLRSGHVLGLPMGADLADPFDRPNKANVIIQGEILGGATPMTDGEWFWYAGLIHFIDKYNVRVPQEFLDHAVAQNWRVKADLRQDCQYDYSYFD